MDELKVGPLPEGVIAEPNVGHLPPGRYFIVDPCYLFPSDGPLGSSWDSVVAQMALSSSDFVDDVAGALIDGEPLLAVNTLYGDGLYHDTGGEATFGVDSGSIGAASEALVNILQAHGLELNEAQGAWVELDEDPVVLTLDRDTGLLAIGDLAIPTD